MLKTFMTIMYYRLFEPQYTERTVWKKCSYSWKIFGFLNAVMEWVEEEEECDSVQLILLKHIRDLAARKRVSYLKQKINFGLLYINCRSTVLYLISCRFLLLLYSLILYFIFLNVNIVV